MPVARDLVSMMLKILVECIYPRIMVNPATKEVFSVNFCL